MVKVVSDANGYALYFSRASIPWIRDDFGDEPKQLSRMSCLRLRHIGIYAYRVSLLNLYVRWGVSPLEELESLEQLRLLYNGHSYCMWPMQLKPLLMALITEEDLDAVRQLIESGRFTNTDSIETMV